MVLYRRYCRTSATQKYGNTSCLYCAKTLTNITKTKKKLLLKWKKFCSPVGKGLFLTLRQKMGWCSTTSLIIYLLLTSEVILYSHILGTRKEVFNYIKSLRVTDIKQINISICSGFNKGIEGLKLIQSLRCRDIDKLYISVWGVRFKPSLCTDIWTTIDTISKRHVGSINSEYNLRPKVLHLFSLSVDSSSFTKILEVFHDSETIFFDDCYFKFYGDIKVNNEVAYSIKHVKIASSNYSGTCAIEDWLSKLTPHWPELLRS